MIGPFLLKYDESGLCIPKKFTSQSSLLASDLDALFPITNIEEVFQKVSKVIQDWNVNKTFQALASKDQNSHVGNSQLFVEDILKAIGAKYTLIPPFQQLLDRIKRKGFSIFKFQLTKEFMQTFKIKKEIQRFNTHVELDDFVIKLKKIDPKFDIHYKQETMFLKGMDRAFWLKYYHYEELLNNKKRELNGLFDKDLIIKCKNEIEWIKIELAKASPKEGDNECPYGDPKQSSFIL